MFSSLCLRDPRSRVTSGQLLTQYPLANHTRANCKRRGYTANPEFLRLLNILPGQDYLGGPYIHGCILLI